MLHTIEEYTKQVEITGYRNITFATAEAFLKTHRQSPNQVDLQFFDATLIATPQHLYFATLNALQAFHNKTNISKSIAIEIMLYASAQRQIQKAITHIGIKPQTKNMAVIVVGNNQNQIEAQLKGLSIHLGCQTDESVLELTKDKETKIRNTFQIKDQELEKQNKGNIKKALVDLVVEHIALLATQSG